MKTIGVIPTFNSDSSLVLAVHSLERNGVEKIVIVNDGSSNQNSLSVLSYFRNYKDIEIIDTENSGLSAARNIGIDFAINQRRKDNEFKYIVFLDSDDYFAVNSVQFLKKCLEKSQEKVYAYPVIEEFHLGKEKTHGIDFYLFPHLFRNRLPYSCLYDIETFSSGLRYRKSNQLPNWSEDYDFSLQVLNEGWIPIKVPEATLKYRVNRDSMAKYVARNWVQIRNEIIERNDIYKNFEMIEAERQKYITNAKYENPFEISVLKKIQGKLLRKLEKTLENAFLIIRKLLNYINLEPHSYLISSDSTKILLSRSDIIKKLFYFENNDFNLISNLSFNLDFWKSQTNNRIIIIDNYLRSKSVEYKYIDEFGKQHGTVSFSRIFEKAMSKQGISMHGNLNNVQKENIEFVTLLFFLLSGSKIIVKSNSKNIYSRLINKIDNNEIEQVKKNVMIVDQYEVYLESELTTNANL